MRKHKSQPPRTVKVLCVSDHIDPLIYSNGIKERFKSIGLVLGAGDLELPYYGYIVSSLNKPLGFVFGNHNLKRISFYRKEYKSFQTDVSNSSFLERSFGSTYLGDRTVKMSGLLLAGLGGSMRYNKGMNQFSEFQMAMKILKLLPGLLVNRIFRGRWLDILLTHAPPAGIHDREDQCHRGFKVFLLFMKLFKPAYLVHGHVHLYDLNATRKSTYRKTTVVNAYEHIVIEVEVPR
ncbi:metallophosphoesterase [Sediminispirochaeta bajacaliforniensis]|uniref:metallophosphoesterase n=1 Tax=Sediminispirochaeta bajacaliforniensis TaxID=148 RepID=UPI00036B8269|nr:metallophosphoesterase [Sediminispirochaeta bajacaliforniensis]